MKEFYEIREDQKCYIFESVLAMWDEELATFWRIFGDGDVFEIHLKTDNFTEICSEGYWECVEISGSLSNGSRYLCHSTSPQHAMEIMKVLPSCITSISIRLDPNPLRNWDKPRIDHRIQEWRHVCRKLCPDFPENSNLIFDFQML